MMNVKQLYDFLTTALDEGLDHETTVVVQVDGEWYHVEQVIDPAYDDEYIWLSIIPSDTMADGRTDYGHYPKDGV